MVNKIAVSAAWILAGATLVLATGADVDQTGTYPKPGTYTGVNHAIPLCTHHKIKMPCPPAFTPGETSIHNNG